MEGCCCGGLFGSVNFGSLLPRYKTYTYICIYIHIRLPIALLRFFFLYVGTYIGYNIIQVYISRRAVKTQTLIFGLCGKA